MTLPLLDVAAATPDEFDSALVAHGSLLMCDPWLSIESCSAALVDAAALFALPEDEKRWLDIKRSAHFRGYSRMHNERDFREQFHFGRQHAPRTGPEPYARLEGPNLLPSDVALADRLAHHFEAVERAGIQLLSKLAAVLGLDSALWLGADPYLVAKCIGYHLQSGADASLRRTRCSIPVFVNPSLDTVLARPANSRAPRMAAADAEHVHAVLDPASPPSSLHFGVAEWRRKGENLWCALCTGPVAAP